MILIDTSAWIGVYRDRTGRVARQLGAVVGQETVATTDCVMCEVLQGTRDDNEWSQIYSALSVLEQLPMTRETWIDAARIFFDLQRTGITIRSTLDCCIAQLAISHDATLLHSDRDFERIALARPLKQRRFIAA